MEDTAEQDPFLLNTQLNTEDAGRGFHRYNDGDEIQRPDVVDDLCLGLLLQTRIDRIVHGTETLNGHPATLIVFGFRFHGISKKRRFKEANITITFQDAKKKNKADPEVIALWPNGDFTLGKSTKIGVEDSKGYELGVDVTGGGGLIDAGGHATLKWERAQSYTTTDRSELTGSILLNTAIRKHGPNNAIRLTISENVTAASGIIKDLRAAVLLRRKNDIDCFSATVKINAKAQFLYNVITGFRDLSGFSPANDAVRFKPGVQYLREPLLPGYVEAEITQSLDENNLNSAKLDSLAGIIGTTVLGKSI
ncbi:hypothetical protein HDV63DRAFT_390379 [Trichoderma sp. SZMC 28014]